MARGKGTYGDEGFDDGSARNNGKEFGFRTNAKPGKTQHGFSDAGRKPPRHSSKGRPGKPGTSQS